MSLDFLVEAELAQHDWSQVLESNGSAQTIPIAFRDLLRSKNPNEANAAYWKLDNHVVLQGSLFEAALCLVPAICAALVDVARPKWVKIQLMELLFQIVNGESHPEETARGFGDLNGRCRAAAREGLWVLYRVFQEGDLWRAAKEIIEQVDENPRRLAQLERINREHGRVDIAEPLVIAKKSTQGRSQESAEKGA